MVNTKGDMGRETIVSEYIQGASNIVVISGNNQGPMKT